MSFLDHNCGERNVMSVDHNPHQCGELNLMSAEASLNQSELFRAECKRLLFDIDKTCKRMQNDEKQHLDQQVREMHFQRKELELKLEDIILETDELIALQNRVLKAIEASKEPLRVTNLCLKERLKSLMCERLHDEVDDELLKEKKIIEDVAPLLQRVVEQISEQIRLNRSVKYYLEKDVREKCESQYVTHSLMSGQCINPLQMSKNNACQSSLVVTPKQWENILCGNIANAEQQKTNSVSLRTLVESILEQTAADIKKQFQATTAAIQQNVQKIKTAKCHMEEKLPKILDEIICQQRVRDDLQEALKESENCLSVVQERLTLLQQRPCQQQLHDATQTKLLAEIKRITAHINKLHENVVQSEKKQRELARCQLKLQKSIDAKASCLYIDNVICMQHRSLIVL